jgi:hypothetical protein
MKPLCQNDSLTSLIRMTEGSLKDALDVISPRFKSSCPSLWQSESILVPENAKRQASSVLVPLFDILMKHESMAPCKYCKIL